MKAIKYILPILTILCFLACSNNRKKMTIQHQTIQNNAVSDHRTLSRNMQKGGSRNHNTVKATQPQKQTTTRLVLNSKKRPIQNRRDKRRLKDLQRRTLSKYFADNKADTLKAGRAELCVPGEVWDAVKY